MMGTLLNLFFAFVKIGLLGFGGGLAIISLIFDSIQTFGEMTLSEFSNIVAIAQATPGPIAVNTATYVGFNSAGFVGAAVATLGVAVPAFVLVSLICRIMRNYAENPYVKSALSAIKPATVGMMASALVTVGAGAFFSEKYIGLGKLGVVFSKAAELLQAFPIDPFSVLICIITIVLIGKYKKNPLTVLIIMGCIGAILGV